MSDSVRPAFVVLHTEARDSARKANNNLAKMEKALCLESAMRDGCCPGSAGAAGCYWSGAGEQACLDAGRVDLMQAAQRRVACGDPGNSAVELAWA